MALTLDECERLQSVGEFAAIIDGLRDQIRHPERLDVERRVILARSLVAAGRLTEALELSSFSLVGIPARVAARAESVLGTIAWRRADLSGAAIHLRQAAHLAKQANDHSLAAWIDLYGFRLAIDTEPTDVVAALLPRVRRSVNRAGDPRVAAYLHCCVAIMEAQRGHLDEGWRHCDIADSLLKESPNHWISTNILLNRASIACLRHEFANTSWLLTAAAKALRISENHRLGLTFQTVAGYVEVLTGEFEAARDRFTSVINDPHIHPFDLAPQVINRARSLLALGQLDEAEEAISLLGRPGSPIEKAPAFNQRWGRLVRAHILRRRGEHDAALELLIELRVSPDAAADLPFQAATELAIAQLWSSRQNGRGFARHITGANSASVLERRELIGNYYLAAASGSSGLLQQSLRDRALRIWSNQDAVYPLIEAEGISEQLAKAALSKASRGQPVAPKSLEALVSTIGAAFVLAYDPRLLGAELISILKAIDCSSEARLVSSTKAGATDDNTVALTLGTHGKKIVTLVCSTPQQPTSAVLLAEVMRIGRAAVALENARREERKKAALWPESPIEEQAGAVFLAEEMQALLTTARRIAATNIPVLITGETGTGKEVLARMIHGYSPRAARTFLPFNCTATPRDMLDAQLFGHRRGAFTGATENFSGIIRAASGGTLFLDEIGETTLDVQPKLLRFLEAGEVHPIGESHPAKVDVRVIAATNAQLDDLVAQGRFREDLFYRLNIVRLHVPPLRERRVEIPALANHYLQKHALEWGKQDLRLAEETMEYLVLYKWPGNVRQLANEMRRMAALAESGAVLMPEHLSPEIAASRRTIPPSERTLDPVEVVVRMDQPLPAAVQHLERAMIQHALATCDGRFEETAAILGLSRKGLYLKRQRLGIDADAAEGDVEVV